jgi:DNA polymerase-3 subunit gamma/tau
MLQQHFASICRQENVEAEDEALHLIAGAAEGSVRDGLSILDQAIAQADLDTDGKVTAARVRDMLGLADKGAQRRLFAHLLEGDAKALMAALADQYSLGVEPLALMRSLMELTNRITVCQVGGSGADAPTAEERAAIEEWAGRLSPGQLHRLWQLLLKGYDEVRGAPDPLVAAQMALLRALHASDMPDPGTLAKTLEDLAARAAAAPSAGPAAESAPAAPAMVDWATLVSDNESKIGRLQLASQLRMQVRPVEVVRGRLVFAMAPGFPDDLTPELKQALLDLTGERWQVDRIADGGAPTLYEREQAQNAAAEASLRAHPLVEAAFAAFPDAELLSEQENAGSPPWRTSA